MADGEQARAAPWDPSGVVTLLTDFGLQDTYVGVMKGVILGLAPGARIVDLTHAVAPQDVRAAGFWLAHAWRWFPRGTVHVAVVDPGVGSAREILVARQEGHVFLAPDNGLLGEVLGQGAEVRRLDVERHALPARSATFHGRDVFAPTAARLAAGLAPERTGAPCSDWTRLEAARAAPLEGGGWRARVVLADRFGNLITDLTGAELGASEARGWTAHAAGQALPVGRTYADVAPGEALALLDSFACWELAVRDGDAARRLGLGPGAEVLFRPGPPHR